MIKRNDLPPLNSLPVFVAVMKTKSYTKAAEQLFMTHSAVSQSIKKLESHLSKKLFITDKRKLIITDLAREYYVKIEPLITEIYHSTKIFKEPKTKKLVINCMTTLCANWLIPRFDSFIETFENIEIQLITIGRPVNFDIDDIDLSIEYGTESDFNNLSKHKLTDGELVLVCNNNYKGKTVAEIIANQNLIYVDDNIRINDYSNWRKYNDIDKKYQHKKEIIFKNSLQAIKACLSGIGFFVTEKLFIEEYIQNNLLYIPNQKYPPTGRSYYLLAKNSESDLFIKAKLLLISLLGK
ncbi:LysR family transcriptional regulator [Francisella tularensis subsp. novicida]|uniref:LysR family transcriptional regulator n=1 Tax=Francisella TaxID=262 RepID=UPI000158B0E6|nr:MULTISPECIES: LysR family transcriptional regulator [Francisella]AJI45230.1 bacterial regulatory helix-turn-helix, lysR family protein [Francisella tularensis subsp. novicida F6168]AJJ46879.1 bacterial regulatory helix-turn-helix, lysR family protein [Francisella tularensis subsp. novicida]APC98673.1 bacterial regulatory helix-turn-helix, lysR family protein [Francisella tularensis subsp. novicida]EDN36436.1 hypothetical protein FTCG_00630 [Francisella tularensis subsp. novicida GA99-3549]K